MPYVEFYKLNNDGSQKIIAVCRLRDGQVDFEGDENLIKNLREQGINDYRDQNNNKLFPKDNLDFLQQLAFNFKSGYLNASEVKE